MKPKKKFSETKVGSFLKKIAPHIFNVASSVYPTSNILNVVKGLITDDKQLTPQDKETALKLLQMDVVEMQEVSKRWESDMKSDSWLSKNTRPMTLIFLTISTVFIIILDSLNIDFGVNTEWIDLLKSLLITTYVAYFGSRGVEKFKAISK
tara:strand:- start:169 stop:621 length:453 start_codon:yes stop_codon:yes gene_type:complete